MADSVPNIFPFMRFADADGALEWLSRAFGFQQREVYRDDRGVVGHAEMSLGPGIIMFGPAFRRRRGSTSQSMTWTNISSGPGRLVPRSSGRLRTPTTDRASTRPVVPKGTYGVSAPTCRRLGRADASGRPLMPQSMWCVTPRVSGGRLVIRVS